MKEAIENINYKDFNIVLKKEANFNSAYSTSIYCDGKLLTEFKNPIPYEESLEAAKAYCDNYLNQKGIKVFESFKDYISSSFEMIDESGGTLKIEKKSDGKYYWIFKFKDSKKEESSSRGFSDKADAQRDFMYASKFFESFKDYMSKSEKINESIADKQWVKKELGDFNKKQNPDKSDFQYLTDSILKHLGIKVKDSSDITEHLFDIWSDTERFEKNEFNDIISSLLSFVK